MAVAVRRPLFHLIVDEHTAFAGLSRSRRDEARLEVRNGVRPCEEVRNFAIAQRHLLEREPAPRSLAVNIGHVVAGSAIPLRISRGLGPRHIASVDA